MNCREWLEQIREWADEDVKVALVANKKDLVEDNCSSSMFKQYIDDETDQEKDVS